MRRLAELGRDQLLQLLGDVVLEHLGLRVHAVPGHSQDLGQEELDQPVVADHLEGDPLALRRQARAVIRLVLDHPLVRQALEHRGRRRRRDAETLRDCVEVATGLVVAPLKLVDRLGVVLGTLVGAPLRMCVVGLCGHPRY